MNHFIIIGAQRSGSTFLLNILDQHSQICFTDQIKPEPKFFIDQSEVSKGINYYRQHHFKNRDVGTLFLGEKSTSYVEFPEVGDRIKKLLPHPKLFMIIRNPTERAISNYYFSCNNKLENRSIEEVFLMDTPTPELPFQTSVSPFNYIERGFYSKYIHPFKEQFGADLHLCLLEELLISDNAIDALFNHLNLIRPSIESFSRSKINASDKSVLPVPSKVRLILNQTYEQEIEKLRKTYDLNTSLWKQ
ncbi:MAG: sulfotransferase [Cyclobacteriaceae bacterium]|nr:sulfotransferase [Cyclobacteriaceae bacterium]MCH8516931.1 sulfotransferase [Cyclobacteriaceae bacterium]